MTRQQGKKVAKLMIESDLAGERAAGTDLEPSIRMTPSREEALHVRCSVSDHSLLLGGIVQPNLALCVSYLGPQKIEQKHSRDGTTARAHVICPS